MAIKMKKNKDKISCDACKRRIDEGAILFDIYIGHETHGHITTLCDGCMHELLQKLIKMGQKHEVR